MISIATYLFIDTDNYSMENKYKYILIIAALCIILAVVIFTQTQAFKVDRLQYNVLKNGDAQVTASYKLNFVEQVWLWFPMTKDGISSAIKTEYGEDSEIISMGDTKTEFTIPHFADKYDTYIQTPTLTFENIKKRSNDYWFISWLNIDYSPTVTIIKFFDGTEYKYDDKMFIPALTLKL